LPDGGTGNAPCSGDFWFQDVVSENDADFPIPNVFFLLTFLPAKPEAPPAPAQEKPSLSEEEIERKCKSIIDEFLHINDFKVSQMKTSLTQVPQTSLLCFSLQEQCLTVR